MTNFNLHFEALTGYPPFKWQRRLFEAYFSKAKMPASLDLPTGLGKTSVMAIWLIAKPDSSSVQERFSRG